MAQSKHSLNIHAHKSKNSKKCSLFFVVSVNGERKEIPTGISTLVDAYDKRTMSIVNVYDGAALDNYKLQEQMSVIRKVFLQTELSQEPYTLADVLRNIEATLHPENAPKRSAILWMEAYDEYLKTERINGGWSDGTYKHKKVNRSHYEVVFAKTRLNDVDDVVLTRLTEHFSPLMRANTLDKLISDTRTFLRWCAKNNIYKGNSHETYHPVIKGANDSKEIIYLTFDELKKLQAHEWSASERHLERVVDAFLFACFCGLRHSDVYHLKRSKIYDGTIHVRTIKTGVNIDLPLNSHTQRILDKYKDYRDCYDHPFPVVSDQKSNDYIKEACKVCNIDYPLTVSYTKDGRRIEETKKKYEWISFHCARRTFITNAFYLNIPAEVIIKFTGHSDLRQLKAYLAVSEKLRKDNMALFDSIQ